MTQPVPILNSTHRQKWQFSRFSYLEQPRPDHGLLLVRSGQMEYVTRTSRLLLQPGDLVYLPLGSRYEARFHPGTEDLLLNFHFADGEPEGLPGEPSLVLTDRMHTLQPLMEQTNQLFAMPDRFLEALSCFLRFCHQLKLALQVETGDQALVQRAKGLLSQPDCPSLEEVARRLLVSSSGLRKKFKDVEGIPPNQYRQQQRLEEAKRLLLSTDMPVVAVAETCGFCDSAHFHKAFSKATGMNPTAYRMTHTKL